MGFLNNRLMEGVIEGIYDLGFTIYEAVDGLTTENTKHAEGVTAKYAKDAKREGL